jgi:hypothetical protein
LSTIGAHDAGDVVDDHKGDERVKEAVSSAEKPADAASNGGKYNLNPVPDFFHDVIPPF